MESLITPPPGHTPAPDLSPPEEESGVAAAAGWGAMAVLRGAGVGVEYVDASDDNYCAGEEDEDVDRVMMDGRRRRRRKGGEAGEMGGGGGGGGNAAHPPRTAMSSEASGLSYDSVKYTLVVDEHAQLELVSLRHCYHGYSDDSDSATVYDNCVSSPYESALGEEYEEGEEEEEEEEAAAGGGGGGGARREATACLSDESTPDGDLHFSKKFLNVFMNGRSRSSSKSVTQHYMDVLSWI